MSTNNYTVVKGCVDYWDKSYNQIKFYKDILEDIFIKNNGTPLETPVFENKEVLMNKYGDEAETKLVYNINEEGGQPLTLRYDHTVPFIRFVKENGIKKMRRYTIGKVYRRDQPQVTKGRLREFYQADFDILGESNTSMLSEIVILRMISDFMNKISQPNYKIYINHTGNLNYILCDQLGLEKVNFKKVCGLIDKVDFTSQTNFTNSFDQIKEELTKYFPSESIDKLKQMIQIDKPLDSNVFGLWNKIESYAKIFGFESKLSYSSCLARGLDYYNGFIFEVKLLEGTNSNTIIAGGRYDSMLEANTLIGVSFGISRIHQLINSENKTNPDSNLWTNQMYVTTLGKISVENKLMVIKKLSENNLYNSYPILFDTNESDRKLTPILNLCIQNHYKYLVLIAENEFANGQVIIKNLELKSQELFDL